MPGETVDHEGDRRVSPRRVPTASASPLSSPERRGTATPSSASRFAAPTASSRLRNTAIAASLTQPVPASRYETTDDEDDAVAGFTFPSSANSTQRDGGGGGTARTSVNATPCRTSPQQPGGGGGSRRARYPLSSARRREQKRQSVQELIGIADGAVMAVKKSSSRTSSATPRRQSTDGTGTGPTASTSTASPGLATVEADVEEALRGRHRHSVVVVPEETMAHFDGALRASPGFNEAAQGEGARAVTDAADFSLDVYRELHHRTFHSKGEELSFLRHDYVALRKTLMLMCDENARLKSRLRERTDEVVQLQARVDICEHYHKGAESAVGAHDSEDDSGVGVGSAGAARRTGSTGPDRRQPSPSRAAARAKKPAGKSPSAQPRRSPSPAAGDTSVLENPPPSGTSGDQDTEEQTPAEAGSSLWLHAAAQKTVRQLQAANKGRNAGPNDLNTIQLITELRRNLARRDTQLDALRLESADFAHARNVLERDLGVTREELRTVTHDRNRLLQVMEEKERALDAASEAKTAAEKALSASQQRATALDNEVEKLRLLQGGVSPTLDGSHIAMVSSSSTSGDGPVEVQRLRDEVRDYRQRWQAAEDRVDQLQRAAVSSSSPRTPLATPPIITTTALTDVDRQRLERELQQQADELSRLHRRLEREQEAAQFRESQQRQQAQDQARLHRTELAAVQEQLQAAKAQLEREGHDRDALVRQLRQTSDQDAFTQVLQSQLEASKQRLAELSGQLSEVRGRERALQIEVQKGQHEKLLLTKSTEAAESTLRRAQQEESLLREEVGLLRSSLGVSEGKVYALEQMVAALQRRERQGEKTTSPHATDDDGDAKKGRYCGCDDCHDKVSGEGSSRSHSLDVDAQALASDLKGYAALMELNSALTTRLGHLEDALASANASLDAVRDQQQQQQHETERDEGRGSAATAPVAPSVEPLINEEVARQRYLVMTELQALRHDLQLSQRAQQTLLVQWQDLRQKHNELEEDNLILAEGSAVIHEELMALLHEKEARGKAAVEACQQRELSSPAPVPKVMASKAVQVTTEADKSAENDEEKDGEEEEDETDEDRKSVSISGPLPASPLSSRRVRSLRGTVEAARFSHDGDVQLLTEENKALARRVVELRKRVGRLRRHAEENMDALSVARRECAEYEDIIRLLDNSTRTRDQSEGGCLERLLSDITRRQSNRSHCGCSHCRSQARVVPAVAVASLSSSSLSPLRSMRSRDHSRRRHRSTSPRDANSDGDHGHDSFSASWCSASVSRMSSPSSSSSSSPMASNRRSRHHHHDRGHRTQLHRSRSRSLNKRRHTHASTRRHCAGRSASPGTSSPRGSHTVEAELYAVNCSARRDRHGVLRETWTAVPLVQMSSSAGVDGGAPKSSRTSSPATNAGKAKSKTKKTNKKDKKAKVTVRAAEPSSSSAPHSARSTNSALAATTRTKTSVTAAVLFPKCGGVTC